MRKSNRPVRKSNDRVLFRCVLAVMTLLSPAIIAIGEGICQNIGSRIVDSSVRAEQPEHKQPESECCAPLDAGPDATH